VLVVTTFRHGYRPSWSGRSHVSQIALGPLSTEDSRRLVASVLAGDSQEPVVRTILARGEGNPLFLEELACAVGEQGSLSLLQVPDTVHDVLAARIAHLSDVDRLILRCAAVVGRDVPLVLLRDACEVPSDELSSGLSRLQSAEFLYPTRLGPEPEYTFKHALTYEVAYDGFLEAERRAVHARVAVAIEKLAPETRERRPEILARHYTEAGRAAQAVPYWLRAGQRAIERSANAEAVSDLRQGLAALESVPEGPARIQHELALQLALGAPLTMLKGHAAPEVEQVYARAYTLCQQMEAGPQRFSVLRGLWFHAFDQARYQAAHDLSSQCLTLAQCLHDPTFHHEAYRMLWGPLFMVGDLVAARAHIEQAIALIDREKYRTPAADRMLDPGVLSLGYASWTLWMLGYPDQARARSREAAALADQLLHAYTRAFALHHAGILHQFLRDVEAVQANAAIVIPLARDGGFVRCLAGGLMRRGWALAEQGAVTEGVAQIQEGLATWRHMGVELGQPLLLAHLAEAYGRAGRAGEGLRVVAQALEIARRTGERYYEAELLRLKGDLLLQSIGGEPAPEGDHPRVTEAEECLSEAVNLARQRQARALELRAATSLARLGQRHGQRADTRRLLAEVYGWFTEGFDTPDLREARSLLEAWP
jgi:predicted ATPase